MCSRDLKRITCKWFSQARFPWWQCQSSDTAQFHPSDRCTALLLSLYLRGLEPGDKLQMLSLVTLDWRVTMNDHSFQISHGCFLKVTVMSPIDDRVVLGQLKTPCWSSHLYWIPSDPLIFEPFTCLLPICLHDTQKLCRPNCGLLSGG